MQISAEELLRVLPAAGNLVHLYVDALNAGMAEFGIDTGHEISSFISQVGHETQQLRRLEENLNYSDAGLLATWPSRFDLVTAARYARKPREIANHVYANRFGNRDQDSGDGWKFRGRGGIHVTFHDNYAACGAWLKLNLKDVPELLIDPVNAMRAAGWFWYANKMDLYDDDLDVKRETKIVNGGANGLADREAIFKRALEVWT